MKIALYIEDGLEQIVLTPETETEKSILSKLTDDSRDVTINHGSFYACRGGWTRHRALSVDFYGEREADDSTILVLRAKPPVSEPAA